MYINIITCFSDQGPAGVAVLVTKQQEADSYICSAKTLDQGNKKLQLQQQKSQSFPTAWTRAFSIQLQAF